ncbi:MAG: hypothetical protein CME62_11435 [Halobacteriovoraceae bacterium]|nr:hypothetical protein [Halobacteriovoraceae bacterium]|tara:strand:+ start:15833 stop:16135 length:303 start_codon:yes stop_codon:yes gene_type:complete
MKLIFNLFIFVILLPKAHATRIDIFYSNATDKIIATQISSKFNREYGVPRKLIRVAKVEECHSRDKRFIEICLNKKSDLIVLNEFSLKQKIRSLEIFFTN